MSYFSSTGDVTSVLRDTTNLEQVREEAKERRKRRKKKRSGSTLVASVFSGECHYLDALQFLRVFFFCDFLLNHTITVLIDGSDWNYSYNWIII